MDSTSLFMFAIVTLISVLFSLIGIFELKNIFGSSSEKRGLPIIGFISDMLAAIMWFLLAVFWSVLATNAIFVPLGYLWYVLGFVFTAFSAVVGFDFIKKASKIRRRKPDFRISSDRED